MKAGWKTVALGDLCDILDNKRKPITKRDRKPGVYPYYGATGIQDFVEGYLFDEPLVLVGEDGAKWASGDNTAFAINGKCWVNNHAHVIRPNRTLLNDNWLIHFLVHSDLSPFVSGLTVPKLNQGNLREIPLPLPPLHEQHRIVGILDEAFEGIGTAKANAEKNLQNARALFESHLQSVFTERGEGWVETTVGDQLTLQRGFDITKSQQGEGDVPVVSSGGIKSFHETSMAMAPGVVIGRKGTLGKCFFIDRDYWPHDTTLWVKDFKGNAPRFVYYLLLGLGVKHLDTGTANPALNRNQVHPIKISWPPAVSKQQELIQRFDSLSEETQRLESLFQQKLTALDDLKKSLLHQAFSGQL
jgi:type I restriction enzyme S subunit